MGNSRLSFSRTLLHCESLQPPQADKTAISVLRFKIKVRPRSYRSYLQSRQCMGVINQVANFIFVTKLLDFCTICTSKRLFINSLHTVSFLSIEIPKKVFGGFDNIFHVYLMRGFQKYERNWILMMAFWASCKIAQPIQPIWQHILALP